MDVHKRKARDRGRVAGQRTVTLLGGIRWDGATFSAFISPNFFELASAEKKLFVAGRKQ